MLIFTVEVAGSFDDSLAIDLEGDGVIDHLLSQGDVFETLGCYGPYTPWIDALHSKLSSRSPLREPRSPHHGMARRLCR